MHDQFEEITQSTLAGPLRGGEAAQVADDLEDEEDVRKSDEEGDDDELVLAHDHEATKEGLDAVEQCPDLGSGPCHGLSPSGGSLS